MIGQCVRVVYSQEMGLGLGGEVCQVVGKRVSEVLVGWLRNSMLGTEISLTSGFRGGRWWEALW